MDRRGFVARLGAAVAGLAVVGVRSARHPEIGLDDIGRYTFTVIDPNLDGVRTRFVGSTQQWTPRADGRGASLRWVDAYESVATTHRRALARLALT